MFLSFLNPGPGGYGVVLLYQGHRKEFSAGFRDTTNNRMEILAAIIGLESLKEKCKVTLYTDSQYEGVRISARTAVTWKLKEGDFTWYKLEITDVHYNF